MTDQHLTVLQRCFIQPFTVQSNYARTNAVMVAELASRGLLTSHVGQGVHSKHWRLSQAGAAVLDYLIGERRS